jgi:hypothetical protein
MRKLLNSLGDRMLSGLLPQDTADADQFECSPQDKCAFSYPFCPGQAFRTKFRRTRCSDGSATPWKRVGCC